jgi:hypothetical protein
MEQRAWSKEQRAWSMEQRAWSMEQRVRAWALRKEKFKKVTFFVNISFHDV